MMFLGLSLSLSHPLTTHHHPTHSRIYVDMFIDENFISLLFSTMQRQKNSTAQFDERYPSICNYFVGGGGEDSFAVSCCLHITFIPIPK